MSHCSVSLFLSNFFFRLTFISNQSYESLLHSFVFHCIHCSHCRQHPCACPRDMVQHLKHQRRPPQRYVRTRRLGCRHRLHPAQIVLTRNEAGFSAQARKFVNIPTTSTGVGGVKTTSTGVGGVKTTVVAADGAYYDLSGRRVTAPARGTIYIHNGKKVKLSR